MTPTLPITYQDVWLNGQVIQRGQRECESRWEAIRPILARYQRPFTLLDFGAQSGYFAFRAVEEFDCVAIVVDHNDVLHNLAPQQAGRIIHIDRHLTNTELVEWSQAEHIDVTLCLSVLHHIPDWKTALEALRSMSDMMIVETPARDDADVPAHGHLNPLVDRLESLGGEMIASTPSHISGAVRPMWTFSGASTPQSCAYMFPDRHNGPKHGGWDVDSDYHTKRYVSPRKQVEREWIPGMNLWNFVQMGGGYPGLERITGMVTETVKALEQPHGDIVPWNFILDGESVHLIDDDDEPGRNGKEDYVMLPRTIELIADEWKRWNHGSP